MPISFLFSQDMFHTGTPFPVQPDQHHLWTPSRRPYTVYLASPIVITEPCHSSSKGCTPMAGYSLKNWMKNWSNCRMSYYNLRCSKGIIFSCYGFGLVMVCVSLVFDGSACTASAVIDIFEICRWRVERVTIWLHSRVTKSQLKFAHLRNKLLHATQIRWSSLFGILLESKILRHIIRVTTQTQYRTCIIRAT